MSAEKEPTITIEDPWLGEREIAPGFLAMIVDQHKLLCHYRDDGRTPSKELLDDIRVYEFIINSREPEKLAEQYADAADRMRKSSKRLYVSKMAVAKNLGWKI